MERIKIHTDQIVINSIVNNLQNDVLPAIKPLHELWQEKTGTEISPDLLLNTLRYDISHLKPVYEEHLRKEYEQLKKKLPKAIYNHLAATLVEFIEKDITEFECIANTIRDKSQNGNVSYLKVENNKIVIDEQLVIENNSIYIENESEIEAFEIMKRYSDSCNELWRFLFDKKILTHEHLIPASELLQFTSQNRDNFKFEPAYNTFKNFVKPLLSKKD
jgi:hypothetical protein